MTKNIYYEVYQYTSTLLLMRMTLLAYSFVSIVCDHKLRKGTYH